MRGLGDALSAAGYPTVGVQLAGHGTSVTDLSRQRWQDWAQSVRSGAAELAGRRIVVVGMSLGALLGLHYAATEGLEAVVGLVCCGTPLRLRSRRLTALRQLYRVPGVRRLGLTIPKGERGISDPALRAKSRAYPKIPLNGLMELLALQTALRPLLSRITVPTTILHARHDHTASVDNADRLARALAGARVTTEILERSWHVITEDVEREQVAQSVLQLCALLDTDPSATP